MEGESPGAEKQISHPRTARVRNDSGGCAMLGWSDEEEGKAAGWVQGPAYGRRRALQRQEFAGKMPALQHAAATEAKQDRAARARCIVPIRGKSRRKAGAAKKRDAGLKTRHYRTGMEECAAPLALWLSGLPTQA